MSDRFVINRETALIALVAWIELYIGMVKHAKESMDSYMDENLYVNPSHIRGMQAELEENRAELKNLVDGYMGVIVQDMSLL